VVYISFLIHALEDLKLGSAESQEDKDYTLDYIPGSALRGAFIKKYIDSTKIEDIAQDSKSRSLLLEGKAKFLNAYVEVNNQVTLPFPLCFYVPKDTLKKWDRQQALSPIINELNQDIKEDYKKVKMTSFAAFDRDKQCLKFTGVDTISNLHITKKKKDNNLFRYDAIKQGQNFRGVIALEGVVAEAEEMKAFLNREIVYIGGSKGSGYGKCKIENAEVVEQNPYHQGLKEDVFEGRTLYLYALSDILYLGADGRVRGDIEPEFIKEYLNLESVTLKRMITETTVISGYNTHWGSKLPQYRGIKAGSIFKYAIEGDVDLEKVNQLIQKGIGQRTAEGFGQVTLLDSFDIQKIEPLQYQNLGQEKLPALKSDKKTYLQMILKSIYQEKLEKAIDQYIYEVINNKQNRIPTDSKNNQLSNILNLIINMQQINPKTGKDRFKAYMNHMKDDNRHNKSALYQLKDIKIAGKTFLEYIDEVVGYADDRDYFSENIIKMKRISIQGIEPVITQQEVYQYTLKTMERLLRYILRIRGHKGE